MDAAREWTDKKLADMERKMRGAYRKAAEEMDGKYRRTLEAFVREREMREKALDDTAEAMRAHEAWVSSQAAVLARQKGMAEAYAEAATNANQKAAAMANDSLAVVYAENANMAAFGIDRAIGRDTGFTLVSEDAVRHMMGLGEHGTVIPEVVMGTVMNPAVQSMRIDVNAARDILWNRQKFNSAITQGILQGESVPNIVRRLDSVFNSNRAAATRAVRTACTCAENAGRQSSYERAEALGIKMVRTWVATLDERTRESHRFLDGQTVAVDEPFTTEEGDEIMFPGDPSAPPEEVWNCRCELRSHVDGFQGGTSERWSRLPEGMGYDEWKSARAKSADQLKDEGGRWVNEARRMEVPT